MQGKLVVALAATALLAGCGGGSGSGSGSGSTCRSCRGDHVVGIAASGAPLAGGIVALVDSTGARRSAMVAADGAFALEVGALKGPFLIEAAGYVGGRPVLAHSIALQEDVGRSAINVTPLTELLTAYVLGEDPRVQFYAARPDSSRVTPDAIASAETLIARKLRPVLDARGVSGVNVRTNESAADGTGLDGALDTVNLTPIQDQATGGLRYLLRVVTEAEPMVVDPAELQQDSVLVSVNRSLLLDTGDVLPAINERLQALAAQFAAAAPTPAALAPFFASNFLHNGLDRDAFLGKVLLVDASFVGSSIGPAALEQIQDPDHVEVSYTVTFTGGKEPRREAMWMSRVDGSWVLQGNKSMAAASVSYMARIVQSQLSVEQLRARSDLVLETKHFDNLGDVLCYRFATPPGGIDEQRVPWNCMGVNEEVFGAWVEAGPRFDVSSTPGLDERAADAQHTLYIGQPSARVLPYLVFSVSTTEIDPRVQRVHVTGAGLPAAGLDLVRPPANVESGLFVLDGDPAFWNAFNTQRCSQINVRPAGCGLDWSQVLAGSVYQYTFLDAAGAWLGEKNVQLLGRPQAPEAWFASKDMFFPHFTLSPDQAFTMANVLGSERFRENGSVTVSWSIPADTTVQMQGVSVSRRYWMNNDLGRWAADGAGDPDSSSFRLESHWFPLRAGSATQQTCSFDGNTGGALADWGWATLSGRDIYGNTLEHEISPANPY